MGDSPYCVNLTFNYLTRAHILYFFLAVVGIHLGLTSELRQRVHVISELTPEEQDYHLLVMKESLIDSNLSQVSSSELLLWLIETKLAYSELE